MTTQISSFSMQMLASSWVCDQVVLALANPSSRTLFEGSKTQNSCVWSNRAFRVTVFVKAPAHRVDFHKYGFLWFAFASLRVFTVYQPGNCRSVFLYVWPPTPWPLTCPTRDTLQLLRPCSCSNWSTQSQYQFNVGVTREEESPWLT